MRVVFAGTPAFSTPCLAALLGADSVVLAGVYTRPDRPAGRGGKIRPSAVKAAVKECAAARGLPVFQPESLHGESAPANLRRLNPDLMVVVAYGLLLPASLLAIPPLGCVNLHASLLPRWRGAAPIERAIEAGDDTTGVSLMQMDAGLDTGAVLARSSIPIAADDTGGGLRDKLARLAGELLAANLLALAARKLAAMPQDESLTCYAPKLEKAEAKLDWRLDALALERKVRAFNPWPVAVAGLDGVWLRVLGARADSATVGQGPARRNRRGRQDRHHGGHRRGRTGADRGAKTGRHAHARGRIAEWNGHQTRHALCRRRVARRAVAEQHCRRLAIAKYSMTAEVTLPSPNLHLTAARAVMEVVDGGRTLDDALAVHAPRAPGPSHRRRAWLQEICYGACRYYHYFDGILARLLNKPVKARDRVLHFILINGCYQLEYMRTPDYAVLSESVDAVAGTRFSWADKMLNGVLRNFLKERERLKRELAPPLRFSFPPWLYREISTHWPDHFQAVLESSNRKPPLTVRINQRRISRTAYLDRLAEAGLEAAPTADGELGVTFAAPVPVEQIPGFAEGLASVQDESAQLAAAALPLAPGERVLDGCAAPGGKTCLLLESQPKLAALVAVDVPQRVAGLAENLARLGLGAEAEVAAEVAADRSKNNLRGFNPARNVVGWPPLSPHFAGCAV